MRDSLSRYGNVRAVRDMRLRRFRRGAFWILAFGMAVVAAGRWYTALDLLLVSSEPRAAVDLLQRWSESRHWFAGLPFITPPLNMAYPPATYVLLWPILGWLSSTAVRWLWGVLLIASLAWLAVILLRAAEVHGARERAFGVLLLLSAQATTLVIANGQFAILILPPLVAAITLSFRRPRSLRTDFSIAGLGLFGLVKPTIAAPFCWVYLFCTATPLPGLLIGAAYVGLTLAATAFQPLSLGEIGREYLDSTKVLDRGWGYGSLHTLFGMHGLHGLVIPAALAALLLLGVWVFRNRRGDPLLVAAVTAMVARFWTYHQIYDDLLMFVPLAFLWKRLGERRGNGAVRLTVTAIVAAASFTLVAPGRWYLLPDSAEPVLNTIRTAVWLAVAGAVLLVSYVAPDRAPSPAQPAGGGPGRRAA